FHGAVNTGFFRVWGVGGIWLSLTSWFYCDRTFWKYGHHLFEQVFCIRQLFQLDKIALGRCRLHNLYALLPSYGYSGDRMPRAITPAEDPTHISQPRIRTAARFFKLVNIFPVMYFCLFASMLFFANKMLVPGTEMELNTYLKVAVGFSGIFFFWLAR